MQNPQSQTVPEPKRLDWTTMVVPFLLIIILCLCFLAAPDASKAVLENLRSFLGENFGVGYLAIGLGIFLLSRIWQKWAVFRTGRAHTRSFTGVRSRGASMSCSPLPLASCFMCAAAINRNTPKPAARSSENTQTGLPEP